jgi:hypothetical protein
VTEALLSQAPPAVLARLVVAACARPSSLWPLVGRLDSLLEWPQRVVGDDDLFSALAWATERKAMLDFDSLATTLSLSCRFLLSLPPGAPADAARDALNCVANAIETLGSVRDEYRCADAAFVVGVVPGSVYRRLIEARVFRSSAEAASLLENRGLFHTLDGDQAELMTLWLLWGQVAAFDERRAWTATQQETWLNSLCGFDARGRRVLVRDVHRQAKIAVHILSRVDEVCRAAPRPGEAIPADSPGPAVIAIARSMLVALACGRLRASIESDERWLSEVGVVSGPPGGAGGASKRGGESRAPARADASVVSKQL